MTFVTVVLLSFSDSREVCAELIILYSSSFYESCAFTSHAQSNYINRPSECLFADCKSRPCLPNIDWRPSIWCVHVAMAFPWGSSSRCGCTRQSRSGLVELDRRAWMDKHMGRP